MHNKIYLLLKNYLKKLRENLACTHIHGHFANDTKVQRGKMTCCKRSGRAGPQTCLLNVNVNFLSLLSQVQVHLDSFFPAGHFSLNTFNLYISLFRSVASRVLQLLKGSKNRTTTHSLGSLIRHFTYSLFIMERLLLDKNEPQWAEGSAGQSKEN